MSESNTPVYNINDKIPLGVALLTVIQHFFAMTVFMTYPVIISNAINGGPDMAGFLISATLIAAGIATILQIFKITGSGLPIYTIPNSSYLPASMIAAASGGLPLLYGMLIFSGFIEMLISRFTRFFRTIFPPEVTGVVLFLLGIAIIPFAFPLFFGSVNNGGLDMASTFVGIVTLGTTIILSMSKKKVFKFYSTLFGIAAGLIASVAAGVFKLETLAGITDVELFAVPNPIGIVSYNFDAALMIPFVIAMICTMLKTLGNISLANSYTRQEDGNSLKRGLFAEGAGNVVSGLIGGIGTGSSSSGTGLVIGTGIASRKVMLILGIFLIACGFLPVIGWLFFILPKPILGAVLIYAITFVMINGLSEISSRFLDSRRIFVVILPILIGVSAAMCPYLYADLPDFFKLFFSSPLTSGSIVVVLLGLIFKIGISKHQHFDSEKTTLGNFMIECGKKWTLDKTQTSDISHHIHMITSDKNVKDFDLSLKSNGSVLSAEIVFEDEITDTVKTKTPAANIFTDGNKMTLEYILL